MHIAIEGCAHGELEAIYQCIENIQSEKQIKIDLLICCGDFQAVRNENDLRCMAVPPKYYNMCSFHKYYSGQLKAPVLTLFIGGNHEASNYLQELPFGGWVAPNIYYLGYAGVVNYKGLRIGGISGIYKSNDYTKGHFELCPYNDKSMRSVYHIRNIEVFRLKQLSKSLDIFMSHDWPTEITKFGNEEQLLRFKPYFQDDIQSGNLGSPPCNELLFKLKPKHWFSAHLHCKFAALVPHDDGSTTKFLALDKCLPGKRFLQVLEFDVPEEKITSNDLSYDLEWLAILQSTRFLFSISSNTQYMPSKLGQSRWDFTPSDEETEEILKRFEDLAIPNKFAPNAPFYDENPNFNRSRNVYQPDPQVNQQTSDFCAKLGITDPNEELIAASGNKINESTNTTCSSFRESDFEESFQNQSAQSTSFSRSRLVLPDVLNKSGDEKVENTEEIKLDSDDEEPDVIVESITEGEGNGSALGSLPEDNESVPAVGKEPNEPPEAKKFKRRNASIYENTE